MFQCFGILGKVGGRAGVDTNEKTIGPIFLTQPP